MNVKTEKIENISMICKVTFILFILIVVITGPTRAGFLSEYIQEKSEVYQWQQIKEQNYDIGSIQFVEFTSQKWQDMTWNHRLRLVIPSSKKENNTVILFITGSGSGTEELEIIQKIADNTGIVGAVLHDVPNQPLFNGKTEDEIIAYTFAKYMETGDQTWPLLVPMTNTAVRAMDVVQEYLHVNNNINIEKFVVIGASKRGWTTWLTAAVDNRVKGIVPMVYDNLNLQQQMKHQIDMWDRYSSKIHDYTEMNFPDMVSQGGGQDLIKIVDPYLYRDKITQPKLIVIGTNDNYWPVDALNIYYDDLVGKNYIYYAPNDGHGLEHNRRSVINSICGFVLAVKNDLSFPEIEWQQENIEEGIKLEVKTDIKAARISFWGSSSPDTDFRNSQWSILAQTTNTDKAEFIYKQQAKGNISGFAEVVYEISGNTYSYCTQLFIE